MLAIAWQYLAGRAVATDPTDRQKAEWPPHPDRVFQALVAAWGETGKNREQQTALEWICALPPPALAVPAEVQPCAAPTVFVPVNDTEGSSRGEYTEKGHMGLLPERRARKERCFPATFIGAGICVLIWSEAELGSHRTALVALCAAVTRIGHSSSLVRLWLEENPPSPTYLPATTDARRQDLKLRVPGPGRLAQLAEAFADGGENWQRPPTSRWQGYVRPVAESPTLHSLFDPRLIIMRRTGGECRFGLGGAQVLNLTNALRKTLIAMAEGTGSAAAKAILSGHIPDGAPAETPHAAYFPLAAVGHEHADGHLLGLAIALPRGLSRADDDACFLALAQALQLSDNTLCLKCGAAGTMVVAYDDGQEDALRPKALHPESWCRAAIRWATVTPIVLDRFPPKRHDDADREAAACIVTACTRIGLPPPCDVRILSVSRLAGAPTAKEYSPLVRKTDGAKRWHVHAELRFDAPVAGPILLGAGRYRGYGLCKPLPENNQ